MEFRELIKAMNNEKDICELEGMIERFIGDGVDRLINNIDSKVFNDSQVQDTVVRALLNITKSFFLPDSI